jgi:ectoine hydroxylase-related dioxygenase (phytanoyl-CoA dioxygenase family)
MGWNSTRIGQDDIIHKPPMSNPVGFHQDGAYISDNFIPQQQNSVTMWIALDDADEENGALQYSPGSHKWSYRSVSNVSASSFHNIDEDDDSSSNKTKVKDHFEPLRKAARQQQKQNDDGEDYVDEIVESVETISVRAGEMVVHHQQTWHGSGPNTSKTRSRRALVAHLINGEVQWRTNPPPHYIYGRYYIRGETTPR